MMNDEIEINFDSVEDSIPHNVPVNKTVKRTIDNAVPDDQILDAILSQSDEQLIPWEQCYLPSGGVYYGWPDGLISVRAMTQTAEKILATKRLAQSGQSIDHLFNECCKFPPGFDPSQLLVGDRVFILYFLRGITHGNIYEYIIKCPNQDCARVSNQEYDLNNLITTAKQSNPQIGREPFRVVLPYLTEFTGREFWIELRFMRSHDLRDIIMMNKMKNKVAGDVNKDIDDNLHRLVISAGAGSTGESDRNKIKLLMQKMHARDLAAIRSWFRANTPGIDSVIDITCPHCSGSFKMELPITDSFFRQS